MDYQISIDFGNSFTKVGIRNRAPLDPEGRACSQTGLLQDEWLKMDEHNFCIPTLAARGIEGGKEVWCYGNDLVAKASTMGELRVYRNWKPLFFANGGPGNAEDGTPVRQIGLGYFRWLRDFVDGYCRASGLPGVSSMPVRITLPSFGAQTAAASILVELLAETGWQPTAVRPAVAEPVANSIGIFSEGRNAIWTPDPAIRGSEAYPFYPEMFGDSEFFEATRQYARFSGQYDLERTHWVFVADLGGYTTDFAMLGFDLARPDQAFEAAASSRRGCYAHYSEAVGIADLDRRVRSALPEEQQAAFDEMARASDPRIENFHRLFYATLRPFRSGGVRIAEGPEIESVKAAVDDFADEVALSAERFLDMHQFERVDQLLVTGGGFNVPAVRDALVAKLDDFQLQRVYRPVSRLETDLDGRHARLNATLVRGATALGGASVYFEGLN